MIYIIIAILCIVILYLIATRNKSGIIYNHDYFDIDSELLSNDENKLPDWIDNHNITIKRTSITRTGKQFNNTSYKYEIFLYDNHSGDDENGVMDDDDDFFGE